MFYVCVWGKRSFCKVSCLVLPGVSDSTVSKCIMLIIYPVPPAHNNETSGLLLPSTTVLQLP